MPVPRGKKDNPTKDSIVDDLPALWLPNTTIWGRESSASVAPSVAASCWSRASVSTTLLSTTRVGWALVDMICGGFVAAARSAQTVIWPWVVWRTLVFADRVRRFATVAWRRCIVSGRQWCATVRTPVSAEPMSGQNAARPLAADCGREQPCG